MNALWATLIVEELVRHGVRHFCVCPGSRSTPLTLAIANHPKAESTIHFDERGAAFFALGIGKATGIPAAFVCTSGTAVANALPAVVEASQSFVPMILLTADRPPELQDRGANQTIPQPGIYGKFVRFENDLPCPGAGMAAADVLGVVDDACAAASGGDPGPVHLNCPFREPLAPIPDSVDPGYIDELENWLHAEAPLRPTSFEHAAEDLHNAMMSLAGCRRPLLVIGQNQTDAERAQSLNIARTLAWPTFADTTSGLRFAEQDLPLIGYADAMLSERRSNLPEAPDGVLHIGGHSVSKHLFEWLGDVCPKPYVRVTSHPRRLDPADRVTHRVRAALEQLTESLPSLEIDEAWIRSWVEANRDARDEVAATLETRVEESAVSTLLREAPEGGAVFLGNSLPIRHAERVGPADARCERIHANRGASGIDGNIATAAGIGATLESPVTAIIGDLTALHDLSSFALLRDPRTTVIVVVINNDGGRIFERLPVAQHTSELERFFVAPHGLTLRGAAELFELPYSSHDSTDSLRDGYLGAVSIGRSALLELNARP